MLGNASPLHHRPSPDDTPQPPAPAAPSAPAQAPVPSPAPITAAAWTTALLTGPVSTPRAGPATAAGSGTANGNAGAAAIGPALGANAPQLVLDLAAVRVLRERAAERLHEQDRARPGLPEADREQRGRALIAQVVAEWADVTARERGTATTPVEDRAYTRAVFDWIFRAGPLEPYLNDDAVENILINGYDTVWVDYADRPRRRVAPLTASDDELRELLRNLARRSGAGERTLSTSSPFLALRLPDGSRLQAVIEVTQHTCVTIRRHRVKTVTLDDLVAWGTLEPVLARFLGALIRAKKNVIICGTQGVGKTSLLRALAREIPASERVGTLESEYELFLHELGHLEQVIAFEAREGNGERGNDGRSAGEITIGDMIPPALRMTLSRMIVGEVRSSEIVPMLRVMTNGEGGSMCTLHVREPHMIFDRIAELCLEYGQHMSDRLAYRLAANAVDYLVFVRMIDESGIGGRRHRFVSHVLQMAGMGENGRPATNTVFGPRGEDPRAVPLTAPTDAAALRRAGFDPLWLNAAPQWAPMHLVGG
ncbi:CpaF family protein [Embleya scabrispora]|uniref:CpaF family protein n=2 Tax=Embleya TaxID=2699295 RepID=UPI00037A3CB1|nr:ATPase, T2SS/T4P/T4SS family [Embleya scabrispora]MYS85410.1 ATP/GTP-binding protein [Streptomyces sp. SID5474]